MRGATGTFASYEFCLLDLSTVAFGLFYPNLGSFSTLTSLTLAGAQLKQTDFALTIGCILP